MDDNFFPKMPHKLRVMLASLSEDKSMLDDHPIYKEGYDDGYNAAQENCRKLIDAVAKVYNIDRDS
jgi:hypothetical protein